MWNPFKSTIETIACLNPLRFSPGEKVVLINDPKQEAYIVMELVKDKSGMPEISRGPMSQLPPSMVYRVESEKWGGISDFRSDSLEAKNQTAVERKVAELNQKIKVRRSRVIDYNAKIEEEEHQIWLLQQELSYWQKEPEHTV